MKSTERIYGKLNILQSRLAIHGSPINSNIEINGTRIGTLPLSERTIGFGLHNITVSKPGFYTYNKSLLVNKSDLYTISINLSPKSRTSATLYSTLLPGSGQIYSGRTTQGILLGAASLGGLAVTFALNSSYQDKRNQYLDNKQAYEDNTDPDRMTDLYNSMLSSYDNMESTYNSARVAGILTTVIWVYNIVDTYIFFPKQSGVQLDAYSDGDRALLSLYLSL
jgi:TM2 domain-containing membrane protein YozV